MSRHLPPGPTRVPFVYDQSWAPVPLHCHSWILFPLAVWSPLSSRHFAPMPETMGVPATAVSDDVPPSPSVDAGAEQPAKPRRPRIDSNAGPGSAKLFMVVSRQVCGARARPSRHGPLQPPLLQLACLEKLPVRSAH